MSKVGHEPRTGSTRNNSIRLSSDSPRSGSTSAPVNNSLVPSARAYTRHTSSSSGAIGDLSPSTSNSSSSLARQLSASLNDSRGFLRRRSLSNSSAIGSSTGSSYTHRIMNNPNQISPQSRSRSLLGDASMAMTRARARTAQKKNDALVYLDGPQVYTCAQCRTHLTSHDDIISKSFHGRHGRAYLFDQCVNVSLDACENRRLITGLHSVSDIRCMRCKLVVGWTYVKAYESSQKYKEGKYIIEKINLHLEESDYYSVGPPAGERCDRWRRRSMSWGSDSHSLGSAASPDLICYEYRPRSSSLPSIPTSAGMLSLSGRPLAGSPTLQRRDSDTFTGGLPSPPL